jgi:hypothetical protein
VSQRELIDHNKRAPIMSRKIFVRPASADKEHEQKDIAKYFVPASTIRAFIPTEYRF